MAKRSLKDLQQRISNESSKRGGENTGFYYPIWKLPAKGTTKIRILEDSDENNPNVVYTTFMEHVLHIGDEKVRVPCPKNSGSNKSCPICELSSKYYKAGDKITGKYYYRQLSYLLRGIVTKDGLERAEGEQTATGRAQAFKFSWQLSVKLKAELGGLDPDEENPWDLDNGIDFAIVKEITHGPDGKDQPKYDLSSGFVRKTSSIPEEWRANIPTEPLTALMPGIPDYDTACAILERHLDSKENGSVPSGDDDVSDESDVVANIRKQRESRAIKADSTEVDNNILANLKKTSSKAASKTPVLVTEDADDDDADDDDADILRQLRDED
jgi:hypothetical protein